MKVFAEYIFIVLFFNKFFDDNRFDYNKFTALTPKMKHQ